MSAPCRWSASDVADDPARRRSDEGHRLLSVLCLLPAARDNRVAASQTDDGPLGLPFDAENRDRNSLRRHGAEPFLDAPLLGGGHVRLESAVRGEIFPFDGPRPRLDVAPDLGVVIFDRR